MSTAVKMAEPAPTPLWSNLGNALASVGRERDWFAEGAIEGRPIILFSGPEKSHKSWTAMQLATATTVGAAWLGRFPIRRPGPVVYLDGEYGEQEFARRVARIARGIGADPREVVGRILHHYSVGLTLTATDAVFRQVLAAVEAQRPSLIVLDPLRNHLAGDENAAQVIVEAFRCLSALRDAGGCPVLVVHHLNKSGGFSGSRAITTRADLILEGSDGETPQYSARGRTLRPRVDAIAQPFTIDVAHDHDEDDTIAATRMVYSAAGGGSDAALPPGLSALQSKIVQFLDRQKESRAANYIARALNRANADVAKALAELVKAGHVELHPGKVLFNGRYSDGYTRRKHQTSAPDEGAPDVRCAEQQTPGSGEPAGDRNATSSAPDAAPDEHQT